MKYYDERTVEFYNEEIKYDEDGNVIHHPLNRLYYLRMKSIVENCHPIAFAGNDLYNAHQFEDIRYQYLGFYGEKAEYKHREAWADKLRGLALYRLLDDDNSWYISFASPISCSHFAGIDEEDIEENPIRKFISENTNRTTWVKSQVPFGYGKGELEHLFMEINKDEIQWAVMQIWNMAIEAYPIQGYCLPKGSIHLLREWNLEPRDYKLFRKVIDACNWIFFSSPAEHWYFEFFTNKYNVDEFLSRINLDDLNVQANMK